VTAPAPPSVANGRERTSGLAGISTTLTYIRQPLWRRFGSLADRPLEAHVPTLCVRRGEVDHPPGLGRDLITLAA
jgi:hypothetical protein